LLGGQIRARSKQTGSRQQAGWSNSNLANG
jgi:hypothetical protein